MKKNLLFLVAFTALFSVFNVSCSSDDEDNTPLPKSKSIKEIYLEYIDIYGERLSNLSAFLSYNSKNQLDGIFYTDEKDNGNTILIDYQNNIIYKKEKQLCLFELNNKGYIESEVNPES